MYQVPALSPESLKAIDADRTQRLAERAAAAAEAAAFATAEAAIAADAARDEREEAAAEAALLEAAVVQALAAEARDEAEREAEAAAEDALVSAALLAALGGEGEAAGVTAGEAAAAIVGGLEAPHPVEAVAVETVELQPLPQQQEQQQQEQQQQQQQQPSEICPVEEEEGEAPQQQQQRQPEAAPLAADNLQSQPSADSGSTSSGARYGLRRRLAAKVRNALQRTSSGGGGCDDDDETASQPGSASGSWRSRHLMHSAPGKRVEEVKRELEAKWDSSVQHAAGTFERGLQHAAERAVDLLPAPVARKMRSINILRRFFPGVSKRTLSFGQVCGLGEVGGWWGGWGFGEVGG